MDEAKRKCLNYAANVPEWNLALALDAVSRLNRTSEVCNALAKAITEEFSRPRLYPKNYYTEFGHPERVAQLIRDVPGAIGDALFSVELLTSLVDTFPRPEDMEHRVEFSYEISHKFLHDLCRDHGMKEE